MQSQADAGTRRCSSCRTRCTKRFEGSFLFLDFSLRYMQPSRTSRIVSPRLPSPPSCASPERIRRRTSSGVALETDAAKRTLPYLTCTSRSGGPVVALESTIIAHGMPFPQNLETAIRVEETVRSNGAVPATICILDGLIRVGISRQELVRRQILFLYMHVYMCICFYVYSIAHRVPRSHVGISRRELVSDRGSWRLIRVTIVYRSHTHAHTRTCTCTRTDAHARTHIHTSG